MILLNFIYNASECGINDYDTTDDAVAIVMIMMMMMLKKCGRWAVVTGVVLKPNWSQVSPF